jgi:hypothetical protein
VQQNPDSLRVGRVLAKFLAVAVVAVLGTSTADAQDTVGSITSVDLGQNPAELTGPANAALPARYFIEFRSRSAVSYGHTFVVYGRLNAQGGIAMRNGKIVQRMARIAGLHPAGDSSIPYVIGHVLPVPAETGPSEGDNEQRYVTASYRVELGLARYRKVVRYIKDLSANSPVWNATFYNCNAFVADIAEFMGLRTPSHLLLPEDFINELRTLNSSPRKHATPHAAAFSRVPAHHQPVSIAEYRARRND